MSFNDYKMVFFVCVVFLLDDKIFLGDLLTGVC